MKCKRGQEGEDEERKQNEVWHSRRGHETYYPSCHDVDSDATVAHRPFLSYRQDLPTQAQQELISRNGWAKHPFWLRLKEEQKR